MILRINREICPEDGKVRLWMEGRDGISFDDIEQALDGMPDEDPVIEIMMNSLGGECDEGFAIYDKLRSTGKEVKAVIQGKCGSMASVILLAASERKAFPHAKLHIHRPFLSFWTEHFGIQDAEAAKAELEELNDRILAIYEERTGTKRSKLEPIMDEDRDMDMEEAVELGFVHEIMLPASASMYNSQFKPHDMNKKSRTAKAVTNFLRALGIAEDSEQLASDYVLHTQEGTDITVSVEEGEEPKVGDAAAPDGTYTLEDGRIITIEDGIVTDIQAAPEQETEEEAPAEEAKEEAEAETPAEETEEAPAEETPAEETEDLKATVEELKAEIEALKAELETLKGEAKSEEDKKALDFVEKAGGLDALAHMQSGYKAQGRTVESNAKDIVAETMLQKELREKKERRNRK